VFVAVAATIGTAVNNLLKVGFGRDRPNFAGISSATGNSFPAGHAMHSTIIYGSLLVIGWSALRSRLARGIALVVWAVLIATIAVSRLVLTVHYASDVVAGVVLGIAFATVAAAVFRLRVTDRSVVGSDPSPIVSTTTTAAPTTSTPTPVPVVWRAQHSVGGRAACRCS